MTDYTSTSAGTDIITILVPNYDKGPYLRAAIDSILAQTDPNWRAIVLDDASIDESRQVLASYAPLRDPRFSIHLNDRHRGLARSLNRLMDLARTELIGELDSDDVLMPECVAEVRNAYKTSDSGLVYSNFTFCNRDLVPLKKGFCAALPPGGTALEFDCIAHFRSWRKSAFLRTGGCDETMTSAIDKDLVFKLEEVTEPYFIDRELYLYRMLPRSLSLGPDARPIAKQNHEYAKATALARRNGDPRAVRRTVQHA